MTLETCKKRYDLAKKAGDKEQMKFWLDRAERKQKKHDKYKDVDVKEFFGIKKKSKG
ncbi:MAG: hypothetical protein ACOC5T_01940 [Elusimicrobiota bacterium]